MPFEAERTELTGNEQEAFLPEEIIMLPGTSSNEKPLLLVILTLPSFGKLIDSFTEYDSEISAISFSKAVLFLDFASFKAINKRPE